MSNTITKADLANTLFDELGLNKREAKEFVELFFEKIRQALESGETVKLSGFGGFAIREKNSRPGRKKPARRFLCVRAGLLPSAQVRRLRTKSAPIPIGLIRWSLRNKCYRDHARPRDRRSAAHTR